MFMLLHDDERVHAKRNNAFQIINAVFELNMLTQDYLLNRSGRAQIQWRNRHESLAKLLASGMFDEPEELVIIKNIHRKLEKIRSNFSGLVINFRDKNQLFSDNDLYDKLDKSFIALLLIESHSIVSETLKLVEITRVRSVNIRKVRDIIYNNFYYYLCFAYRFRYFYYF